MPTVIVPAGASAAGEAFELLASRYLSDVCGLDHLAAPFYTRLARGRWVQFDGLFARADGRRLILEAKFYSEPVSLSTPGITSRVTFAAESGADGIVFCSRSGFARDILSARLPIEKVLLSWRGIRRNLCDWGRGLVTAVLDPVSETRHGFAAVCGSTLITRGTGPARRTPDGFATLPGVVERWVRRLPAASCDIDADAPPRRMPNGRALDVIAAWTVEDSLRGYAPTSVRTLEIAAAALRSGPVDLVSAWKAAWRLGYRGRRGGLKNALENLCVMGAAEKFRTSDGLFYGLRPGGSGGDVAGRVAAALEAWPAFAYFRPFAARCRDKHALSARLSAGFVHLHPYARSLYNPAKVAGLLVLQAHYSPATSSTRES